VAEGAHRKKEPGYPAREDHSERAFVETEKERGRRARVFKGKQLHRRLGP